jgi:hypothetical protein
MREPVDALSTSFLCKVRVRSLCLAEHHDMKLYAYFMSALGGDEWSALYPGHIVPGERTPGTHWIGDWVGPRSGLDAVEATDISFLYQELNPDSSVIQPIEY